MDVRKTLPGGEIGISSNELNLMPESSREGLFSINAGIGGGLDMIISGVNAIIDPGVDASLSAGFIFLNGEMLEVEAQVVPRTVGTDLYQFAKVTTSIDPNGDRDFRDGTSANVYEKNRGIAVNVAAITGLSVTGNTMLDTMKSLIQVQSDFNQTDNTQPDFIKNKPSTTVLLAEGTVLVGDVVSSGSASVTGDFASATKTSIDLSTEVSVVFNAALPGTNYLPIIMYNVPATLSNQAYQASAFLSRSTTGFVFKISERAAESQNLTAFIRIVEFNGE